VLLAAAIFLGSCGSIVAQVWLRYSGGSEYAGTEAKPPVSERRQIDMALALHLSGPNPSVRMALGL